VHSEPLTAVGACRRASREHVERLLEGAKGTPGLVTELVTARAPRPARLRVRRWRREATGAHISRSPSSSISSSCERQGLGTSDS
jgi:hypothetical protein